MGAGRCREAGTRRCGCGSWPRAGVCAPSKDTPSCVKSVTISPDGRWALSGSQDKTLRLWELKRSGPVASLAVARPRSSAEVIRAANRSPPGAGESQGRLSSRAMPQVPQQKCRGGGRFRDTSGTRSCWNCGGKLRLRGKPKCFSGGWLRRTFEGHTDQVRVRQHQSGWALGRCREARTGRCGCGSWPRASCVRTFEGHTDWVTFRQHQCGWALGAVGQLGQDAAAVGAGHGPVCAHVRRDTQGLCAPSAQSGWALGAVGELRPHAAAVGAGHGQVGAHVRGTYGRVRFRLHQSGWALGAVGESRQHAAAVGAGHGPVLCARSRDTPIR